LKPARAIVIAAALAAASAPAWAHHSGAMFDRTKEVVITGTVKEFNWQNPHSNFAVEVMKADGQAELWDVEMNGPQNLVRQGWKRTTLHPGDKVSVTINPLRDGKPGGWYVGISLPNGQTLRSDEPPAGPGASKS
jgi:hypothetical protein